MSTSSDGEMQQRVRAFEWSDTPLGPLERWPPHLRTSVETCLNTRVPLMIVWGWDAIQIYNDAMAPLLGDKHPKALGRSYADSFAEIWDYQGPKFRAVLEHGQATFDEDQQVCFWRSGMLEEMYYTFSWSPITNADGDVEGAFHPASETTGYVVGARRLVALRGLAAGTVNPRSPEHACRLATTVLSRHRKDLPFTLFYLLDPTRTHARLVTSMGIDVADDTPGAIEVGSGQDRWDFATALHDGGAVVDLDQRHGTLLPDAAWPEPARTAMVLPFTGDDSTGPTGLFVAGISPRRPLDDDYVTWLDLVKAQLSHTLAAAQARQRDRSIAVTLQQSLLPEALPDVPGVLLEARYRPAVEYAHVGGDWYDAIHVGPDCLVVVVGDVMGKGVRAAAQMGRLRSAAQAYARLGLSPAAILGELNRFAVDLAQVEFATVLCARYVPSSGSLAFASAGHLPPVLVRSSAEAELVEDGVTVPLASVDELCATETQFELEPGDAVLLYTDGLVERRDRDIDRGVGALLKVCSGHAGDLSALLDAVMEHVAPSDGADDIALLGLRRTE